MTDFCAQAPVQARRLLAQLSSEKHNGFSTLSLSPQKSDLGGPRGIMPFLFKDPCSSMPPQGFLLKGYSSRIPPQGLFLKDSSSENTPQVVLLDGFSSMLFHDSFFRILPLGILLYDSSYMIPSPGFLQDSSLRILLSGVLFQDSFSRIPC